VIAGMTQVDTARQAIFGHSLGGLFVLWCLFRRSGAFRSYMAASPSIWWGERCILADEKAFLETASPTTGKSRLLLTAGSLEMTPTQHPASMSADAQAMANRLSLSADDRLDVSFVEFAGESHASVVPAAISRSLRFAW
jgi:predicted alpha/beta superfamily hydrolase